jgi:hypothetical protein
MTAQASRIPQASAFAICGWSRASRENDKVTAVDDTRPPVNGQRHASARPKQASQHIADQRQARNEDHQQPQFVGVERPPWIDRLVWQERQRDEGRDQQPQAGIDIVPAELLHEAMQRLLVGKHRGSDHAKPDGERRIAEHDHGAEQEHDHRRDLGGQPFAVLARPRCDEIAGDDHGADNQKRGRKDPGSR